MFLFGLSVALFENVLSKTAWKISLFFNCWTYFGLSKKNWSNYIFLIFFRTIFLVPVSVSSYSVFLFVCFFIYVFFLKQTPELFILTLYTLTFFSLIYLRDQFWFIVFKLCLTEFWYLFFLLALNCKIFLLWFARNRPTNFASTFHFAASTFSCSAEFFLN